MNTFAIKSLFIHKNDNWNKDILKVLEPGEYCFNQYGEEDNVIPEDFFAPNICISAIVGKNGSGKSSLLDLMLRIFNNLGYCMLGSLRERPDDSSLAFVPNIFADVNYVIMEDGNPVACCLSCEDGRVSLRKRDVTYVFPIVNTGNDVEYSYIDNVELCEDLSSTALAKLSDSLFYTIGVNYSLHSYIAGDYEDEHPVWHDETDLRTWVDGVFHKNDGYRTPLVLTPYRRDGIINMTNIKDLVRTYTISILAYNNVRAYRKEFIPNYMPGPIVYKATVEKLLRKCTKDRRYEYDEFIGRFLSVCEKEGSVANLLLSSYGVGKRLQNLPINQLCIYIYLIYKTISIYHTYYEYFDFRLLGGPELLTDDVRRIHSYGIEEICKGLTAKILDDRSHITYKIRQTLNLLICLEQSDEASEMAQLIDSDSFELSRYLDLLRPTVNRIKKRRKRYIPKLDEIKEMLPPPVFTAEVFLYEKRDEDKKPIPLEYLSAGEKQFMHTMSTIIYHVDNLRSIRAQSRMRYRKVNIMLDEAELCFHPEMQCQFVKNLIDYIAGTRHNTHMTFNIIIVTHSPFILSDIPQNNILYLKKGKPDYTDKINPFAANVNDILHQSFFMTDGFIGDFARQKIEYIIRLIKKRELTPATIRALSEARKLVESTVGDQLLKELLIDLIDEKDIHNA